MRGADVKSVQEMLQEMDFSLGAHGADSVYGPASKAAVSKFQVENDLGVDGVVGPNTIAAIRREYSEKNKTTESPSQSTRPPQPPRPMFVATFTSYEITPLMEEKNKVISELFDFYQKETNGTFWDFSLDSNAFSTFYPIVKNFVMEFEKERSDTTQQLSQLGIKGNKEDVLQILPRLYVDPRTGKLDKVICFPNPNITLPKAPRTRYQNGRAVQTAATDRHKALLLSRKYHRDYGCRKLEEGDFKNQNNKVFTSYLKNYDEIYDIALRFKNSTESDGSCTEVGLNNLLSKYSVNNPSLRKVFEISKRKRWFATLPEVDAVQFLMAYVPGDLSAAALKAKLREKTPNEIINGYIAKINSLEGMSEKETRKLYNDLDSLLRKKT